MRFATTAIIALIAVALPTLAAPDSDAEAAFEALRTGGVQEAKARFESAIKRNPSDHTIAFARAATLPAADALKAMDSLGRVQSAPGWVKARSLRFLGDHRFAKGDYKKAADFYLQASKLDNSSVYKHLYALSIAADGRLDTARVVWAAIAEDSADGMSAEAVSLLQQVAIAGQPPVPFSQPPAPPLVLAQGARVDDKAVAPVNQQVAPVSQQPVQQGSTQSAGVDDKAVAPVNQQQTPVSQPAVPVNQQQQTAPAAGQQEKTVLYTVQVGAFGSKDNADNLVKRLIATYGDVYVSPVASGDQTLYRVRVGSFSRREDAVALADKLITSAGLSARVFEK